MKTELPATHVLKWEGDVFVSALVCSLVGGLDSESSQDSRSADSVSLPVVFASTSGLSVLPQLGRLLLTSAVIPPPPELSIPPDPLKSVFR